MNLDDLPEGWELKPLRSCVAPKQIWNATRQPRDRIRYIELSGINNQRGVITNVSDLAAAEAPSRAKKMVRQGDVIFATTRPNLKNIAMVPGDLDNEICSTGFCVLRPLQEIVTSGWLFAVCRSDVVVSQVVKHDEKNAYPSVSDDEVLDCLVPIPPPEEQNRLIKRIEALTSRLEQARQARQAAMIGSEAVQTAALAAAFDGDGNWIETTLSEVCTMKTGKTPPTGHPEYFGGEVPFVCPADVGGALRISKAERTLTRLAVDQGKANLFSPGTVLLVGIGSTVGKVGLADAEVCTNQQITGLTFQDIDSEFAAWQLVSQRAMIENAASDGGVPIINQKGIGQLPFRYPPDRAEQRRIVSRLDALAAKHAELRRLQTETEAELTAFTPALLAKAFRGEL